MGFRSVLFTGDEHIPVPQWFLDKHPALIALGEVDGKPGFPIGSKWETKFYDDFITDERLLDLQKILIEHGEPDRHLDVILLHECGGITKVWISPTHIIGSEPGEWDATENVTHSYCYGCSDVQPETLEAEIIS